jgi:hypothetical protein
MDRDRDREEFVCPVCRVFLVGWIRKEDVHRSISISCNSDAHTRKHPATAENRLPARCGGWAGLEERCGGKNIPEDSSAERKEAAGKSKFKLKRGNKVETLKRKMKKERNSKGGNSKNKKTQNDERSQDLPFRRLRSFWVCISWSQLWGF